MSGSSVHHHRTSSRKHESITYHRHHSSDGPCAVQVTTCEWLLLFYTELYTGVHGIVNRRLMKIAQHSPRYKRVSNVALCMDGTAARKTFVVIASRKRNPGVNEKPPSKPRRNEGCFRRLQLLNLLNAAGFQKRRCQPFLHRQDDSFLSLDAYRR